MKKRESKKSLILKPLISIVLGFLPSFLFVLFIIPYGSPIINYFNFLSNFNVSLGAWVSGILIALFSYFLLGLIDTKSSLRKILQNKILTGTILFLFIVAFTLIAIQLYLYANFILRNDILVELSSTQNNIFFENSPEEKITFRTELTMNPFCTAQCEYKFHDISTGEIIDKGHYNTTILSKQRAYKIKNNNLIEGSQELKQFEVSCKSKKTLICYTSEKESKRKILLTINYKLSKEETEFKENSKNKLIELNNLLQTTNENLNESAENINSINNSFSTELQIIKLKKLQNDFKELNYSIINSKKLWEKQKFPQLKTEIETLDNELSKLENESSILSEEIIRDITLYNSFTQILNDSKEKLETISENHLDNSLCLRLNEIINNYNKAIPEFREQLNLTEKQILIERISSEINEFYETYFETGEPACILKQEITQEIFPEISLSSIDLPLIFSLEEPDPICCFKGICERCLNEQFSNLNYPILFLHGQSINKELPIGYSFDTFSKIKEELVKENYIDAGSIVLSPQTEKGLWGKINKTMIMTGSYFFDTYKTEMGEVIISSNKEGIDTYAMRLDKLIKLIKEKTSKEKVIIISHSMGGIVSRRYIQIFGNKSINKLIMVTSPNHGVSDNVRDSCSIIGPETSCRDLDSQGIFINILNNDPTEKVETHNIIGIGCNMKDETGDGVIKNSSQYLITAQNYYFQGQCNELNFKFFHEHIIDPDLYPEVYNQIYKNIQNQNNQSNSQVIV